MFHFNKHNSEILQAIFKMHKIALGLMILFCISDKLKEKQLHLINIREREDLLQHQFLFYERAGDNKPQ